MKINLVNTIHAVIEKKSEEAKMDFRRLSTIEKIATIAASALGAIATYFPTLSAFGAIHLSTFILLPVGVVAGLIMIDVADEMNVQKNQILTSAAIYAVALICLCGPVRIAALLSRVSCLLVANFISAHTTELFGVINLIRTPRNHWVSAKESGPIFGCGLGRKLYTSMKTIELDPNKSHNRDEIFQKSKKALIAAHPDKNPHVKDSAAKIANIKAARGFLMSNLELLAS